MCGIALATIVRSSATRKAARLKPTISEKRTNGEVWTISELSKGGPMGTSAALSLSSLTLPDSRFRAVIMERGGWWRLYGLDLSFVFSACRGKVSSTSLTYWVKTRIKHCATSWACLRNTQPFDSRPDYSQSQVPYVYNRTQGYRPRQA
jgi:hypothetical protein